VANAGAARKPAAESIHRQRRRPSVNVLDGNSAHRNDASRELDGLIHHRIRLGIVSALAGAEALSFNALKSLLKATDGNLSVHARKLEDAGYIRCTKSFEDRRPHTEYCLASEGRHALQRYLSHMEAIIQATRNTLEKS